MRQVSGFQSERCNGVELGSVDAEGFAAIANGNILVGSEKYIDRLEGGVLFDNGRCGNDIVEIVNRSVMELDNKSADVFIAGITDAGGGGIW